MQWMLPGRGKAGIAGESDDDTEDPILDTLDAA